MMRHGHRAMEIQGSKPFFRVEPPQAGSPLSPSSGLGTAGGHSFGELAGIKFSEARYSPFPGDQRSLSTNRGCSPEDRLLHALAERVVHTAPVFEHAAEDRLLDPLLDMP